MEKTFVQELKNLEGRIIKNVDRIVRKLGGDVKKQVGRLDDRIDETNGEVRKIGVLLEATNDKVDLVMEQYSDIKKTLDVHTEKLDAHTEMIGTMAVDIILIKEGLETKVDKKDVDAVETRVGILEKRRLGTV